MKKRLTLEEIVDRCNAAHNNAYDYSKVIYKNAHNKVVVICNIHGTFNISINNHLYNKRGCRLCGNDYLSAISFSNADEFITKAINIHGDLYSYKKVIYRYATEKVEIICKTHGSFFQTPSKHLTGNGCDACGGTKSLSIDDFINKSNFIHKYKYSYIESKYSEAHSKIKIICDIHGAFIQEANSHMRGSGCIKCANANSSKKERLWLDSLNILEEYRLYRFKIEDSYFIADGYDPNTNTIYEFYGDFWHGNPALYKDININNINKKSFGILYDNTLIRENKIKKVGYNLICIWEHDFDILRKNEHRK